jgi:hypothetical protein
MRASLFDHRSKYQFIANRTDNILKASHLVNLVRVNRELPISYSCGTISVNDF